MTLFLIIAVVIALYSRSLHYKWMPDDVVKRGDYLYNIPERLPDPDFYKTRPHIRVRLWCIANHCINVALVHYLFGWQAALVFAVHPVAVNEVCWVTGNYYAGTALLALTAYFFIDGFGWLGVLPAIAFYTAALNSTITALGLPLLYLMTLNPIGLTLVLPYAMYFRGKRFRFGIQKRKDMRGREYDKLEFKKLAYITKIVARYIGMFTFPHKMGLFRTFGEYTCREEHFYIRDTEFNKDFWLSLSACAILFVGGLYINPLATLWFFCMIAPHSQFKTYGQSNPCNRYLYLSMIGLAMLAVHLPMPVYFMFVGFLVYRTFMYIPAWKDQGALHQNNLDQFPGRAQSFADLAQWLMTKHIMVPETDPDKNLNYLNLIGWYMQESLRINSKEDGRYELYEVYINAAMYFILLRQPKMAIRFTEDALKVGERQQMSEMLVKSLNRQKNEFQVIIDKLTAQDKERKEKVDADVEHNSPSLHPVS